MILPSEGPSVSGRCNYDALSPKRSSNVIVMNGWSADEAVVLVKLNADEGMVTCPRVKRTASDMDVGGKGRNM